MGANENQSPSAQKPPPELMLTRVYNAFLHSTAIAVTLSYLLMILTSTAYLAVLYSQFDFDILKFIALEDLLVTPIKNPSIIFVFIVVVAAFYLNDLASIFQYKKRQKYADGPTPLVIKITGYLFWVPPDTRRSIQFSVVLGLIALLGYIFSFALWEAEAIKAGDGTRIELTLTDETKVTTTLLGTSGAYVFTHDHTSGQSVVYGQEAIFSLKKMTEKKSD